MSLGDDIAAALPEFRMFAESLMTDTIRVESLTGVQTMDPDTLEMVDTYATVYEGPGRWQRPDTEAAQPVAGEVEFSTHRVTVQLPIAVTVAASGQRATVIASQTDPALIGSHATVLAVPNKTHATKRTLLCEEVS